MIEAQTLEKTQVAPLLIAGVSRCPLVKSFFMCKNMKGYAAHS
jgi:hypothetical protein